MTVPIEPDPISGGYDTPGFFDQSTLFEAEPEQPVVDFISDPIWGDYVNSSDPNNVAVLQFNDIDEFDERDEAEDFITGDELDITLDDLITQELSLGEAEVPYEWRYWEHSPDEFPAANESNAPPMPSGWVDPDTDEVVR